VPYDVVFPSVTLPDQPANVDVTNGTPSRRLRDMRVATLSYASRKLVFTSLTDASVCSFFNESLST
jgi:hypothetical protein